MIYAERATSSRWRQMCWRQIGNRLWAITMLALCEAIPLRWCHNERDGVSNHQHHDCSFNCLFKAHIKETSKLRVTGLCAGNSPVTGEFPAQRASNAENVSIWWRHHTLVTRGSPSQTGRFHTVKGSVKRHEVTIFCYKFSQYRARECHWKYDI